jgi:putative Holliday junction resolvase
VRALGVDPGSKRIGLAISDRSGTIASPFTVLQRSRSRHHDDAEIARIVREEEIDVVVVGLPLNMDGSRGPSAKAAIADARRLATVVDVPIELHDERRTTVTAEQSMREAGLDGVERRRRVDKVAAAIMLQSWLDSR